ncbi:serine hydrolase [Acetobacter sacchari]|uniref:Serine hydrolase n=1 Tax=Acetobacter sacchari TaxID=2661687 RepID=A0ABS3LUB5_9PROT|nr:serine hydrolase [Acetobacter sacchari]
MAALTLAPLSAWADGACPILKSTASAAEVAAFSSLDADVEAGLGHAPAGLYPGAVLLVAHHGRIVRLQAFGDASYLTVDPAGKAVPEQTPRAMAADEIFDLASMTKVVSTTAALMHLVDQGRLHLTDKLGDLLPAFSGTDKADITLQQLLTHRAGLWEWQPTWLFQHPAGNALPFLARLPRRYGIGERWSYSDLGFMILGAIVAKTVNEPLNAYMAREIYKPLGMADTGYLPSPALRSRIAATSQGDAYQQRMAETGKPYPLAMPEDILNFSGYRKNFLSGETNDANSWLSWNGVAGHAGLFSTATDVARYAQTLLNGGCYGSWRLASAETVSRFEQSPYDQKQALGFRKLSIPGVATPLFGHPGFTGGNFAIAPDLDLTVILLTNRLHRPDEPGGSYPILTPVWNRVVADAVSLATNAKN